MDKLIVDQRGEATISNDGATILKLLDVVHPAARMLVDAARAQDAEVGDGTTSTTLLAAELLRQCKDFVDEGMNPHIVVKGYRKACQMVFSSSHHYVEFCLTRSSGCGAHSSNCSDRGKRRRRVSLSVVQADSQLTCDIIAANSETSS